MTPAEQLIQDLQSRFADAPADLTPLEIGLRMLPVLNALLAYTPTPPDVDYRAELARRFNALQPRTLTQADLEKPIDPAIFTAPRAVKTRSRHHYGNSDK